jgi:hypothetical protein
MKLLKLTFGLLSLLIVTSCVTFKSTILQHKESWIILQVDSIWMAKAGGQGLLDMALTQ